MKLFHITVPKGLKLNTTIVEKINVVINKLLETSYSKMQNFNKKIGTSEHFIQNIKINNN